MLEPPANAARQVPHAFKQQSSPPPISTMSKPPDRLNDIDGSRGWAALIVLVFHLTWETFGIKFPQYRLPYLKFFLDGPLAVYVFFVLSGDALSNGFIRTANQRSLAKLAVKRYFRLAGPILLSCIIVYALMRFNLTFHAKAAGVVGRPDWLGTFLPFEPNFGSMLRYATLKVFTAHSVENSYNAFLAPMSIELYGSFFIFSALAAIKFMKRPVVSISLLAFYLWVLGSYYSLFLIGLLFSILRQQGQFKIIKASRGAVAAYPILIFVILLDFALETLSFKPPQASIIMAGLVVFAAYSNDALCKFFSNPLSSYLGRISFPLYISHFAVLVSYTSWAIIYFNASGQLDFEHAAFIAVTSLLLAGAAAEVVTRIEKIYLRQLDAAVAQVMVADNPAGPR
jgi:peptidoglycan/LPS O-acetylase OafA/YrhL